MKFYKRDPDRALAGMLELNMEQRGAYNSLLDVLYSRDGDVPDDDVRVAKMMGCHWRKWAALKKQLIDIGKVWIEDGKLRAKRVEETLKEAADFSEEQRKKASKGWQTRRKEPSKTPHSAVKDAADTPQESKKSNENNAPVVPAGNALTPTPTPTVSEDKSTTETERIESPVERQGRSAPKTPSRDRLLRYAWQGRVIRLNQRDYDQWRKSYPDIPDFDAELQAADDYYHENPPPDGKWFFPVSNWLKRANNSPSRPPGRVYDNPVADAQQQAKRLIYGDPPDDEPERDAASAQRSDQGVHPRDYPTLLESAPAYRA